MIGEVDCTVDATKELCVKYKATGFPKLMYFSDETGPQGMHYEGERTLGALEDLVAQQSRFVEVPCNPVDKKGCTPADLKYIEAIKDWTKRQTRDDFNAGSEELQTSTASHREALQEFEELKHKYTEKLKKKREKEKKLQEKANQAKAKWVRKLGILRRKLAASGEEL